MPNTELPCDPQIALPGIHPKEIKTNVQILVKIFISALFTIAKK